jgi:hypothetical protein
MVQLMKVSGDMVVQQISACLSFRIRTHILAHGLKTKCMAPESLFILKDQCTLENGNSVDVTALVMRRGPMDLSTLASMWLVLKKVLVSLRQLTDQFTRVNGYKIKFMVLVVILGLTRGHTWVRVSME